MPASAKGVAFLPKKQRSQGDSQSLHRSNADHAGQNSSRNGQDVVKIWGLRGCIVKGYDQRMALADLQVCPARSWAMRY